MRTRLLLGFALLLFASLLTFFKIPLASSQGLTLIAAPVSGDLPLTDPYSDLWNEATAVQVPLSAQVITRPISLETHTRSITARSLHNEETIAILVEWEDATQDDSAVRVQDFRDMVALQFPQTEGEPFFCMGQQGGNVNIWLWKADRQAEILAWEDVENQYPSMYVDYYPFADPEKGLQAGPEDYDDPNFVPAFEAGNLLAIPSLATPVENLVAGGFGSLTSLPVEGQIVQGHGVWEGGKWRVVFSRSLNSSISGDLDFSPGKTYPIAFAVWDGANEERNGQKSTSQWVSYQLASVSAAPPSVADEVAPLVLWWRSPEFITRVLIVATVLFVLAIVVIYIRLPE